MHNARICFAQPVLLTGFALIILLTISLTAVSLYFLVTYGGDTSRTINSQDLKQDYAYIMRTAVRQRSLNLFAMVTSPDPIDQDEYYAAVQEQGSIFIEARRQLEKLGLSEQEKQQLENIVRSANNSRQYTYRTIELLFNGKTAQAREIVMQNIMPKINTLLAQLDEFIDNLEREYHLTLLNASRKFDSTFNILAPLGGVTLLVIILIAAFISIRTRQSISALANYTEKLTLLEHRERLILQGLFDAVITTDEFGNIQDFNTSAERMFGYCQDEIFGQNVSKLMPEAYGKLHDKFMKNYISGSGTTMMGKGRALLGKRKDGSVFPIDVALTEFSLDNRRIFIGTIRDITKQKENENALHKVQQELEQRVEQRTTELRKANEKLEHLVSHDTLTGLPNRFLFNERFIQELSRSQRHHVCLALLYMDLDGFKAVNDSLGHEAGDTLLREVAERMRAVVRKEDTLARIGGDEFILVASNINVADEATRIAEKIINAVNRPFKLKDRLVDVGISIGISCFPDHGGDIDSLMHQADIAMYQAKQKGKNQYHWTCKSNKTVA